MTDLLEDLSEQAINHALGAGPRKGVLCAVLRTAGRMLAESEGHDFASAVHATEARRHAEARARQGVARTKGRR